MYLIPDCASYELENNFHRLKTRDTCSAEKRCDTARALIKYLQYAVHIVCNICSILTIRGNRALTVAVDVRLEEHGLGHAPRHPLPCAEGDVLFERNAS